VPLPAADRARGAAPAHMGADRDTPDAGVPPDAAGRFGRVARRSVVARELAETAADAVRRQVPADADTPAAVKANRVRRQDAAAVAPGDAQLASPSGWLPLLRPGGPSRASPGDRLSALGAERPGEQASSAAVALASSAVVLLCEAGASAARRDQALDQARRVPPGERPQPWEKVRQSVVRRPPPLRRARSEPPQALVRRLRHAAMAAGPPQMALVPERPLPKRRQPVQRREAVPQASAPVPRRQAPQLPAWLS
jgi:hypothetical protein